MAIPLVIGIAAGAIGLYKAGKAISDNSDASELNKSASYIADNAEMELNKSRTACEDTLECLGQKKADILRGNVNEFLTTFKKIKNIDFQHNGLDNISAREFSEIVLAEMHKSVSFVLSSGLGLGSGSVAGALTAFGAYNGTIMLAAAGTGTAISSLSGVAATNATLAWLGGGTLASGGMGVAGGTMALGALAAGPALLVAGWYMGAKAETNLNEAYSNKAKAEQFSADCDAARALTDGICEIADMAITILFELSKSLSCNIQTLKEIIELRGTDFTTYDENAKDTVLRSVKIIQLIKVAIDTPILDQEGNLLGDASSNLNDLHCQILN